MSEKVTDNRICIDCGIRKVRPQRAAKRPFYRCDECQRRYKREEMQKIRAKKKELVQDDPVRGMKRCTKCKKLKYYSAYSIKKSSVSGELNKICDACLSRMYMSQDKFEKEMTAAWWRQRAYSVNNYVRTREAKKEGIPLSDYAMALLKWKCSPNDLIVLFKQQKGKCIYCGCQLDKTNLCTDHMTPLSREGKHEFSNLALACKDCNQLKLSKTKQEFIAFLIEYANRIISRTQG